MKKYKKYINTNQRNYFTGQGLKSIDGNFEVLESTDIFYIGRGEYYIRKRGIFSMEEITK